jgi:hypothetical protein
MSGVSSAQNALATLALARQIADYAQTLGVGKYEGRGGGVPNHLGAVLADCILQAGVNYKTVVKARIDRIINQFPHCAVLPGVLEIVTAGAVPDFLMWKHPEKNERFIRLVRFLEREDVESIAALSTWLQAPLSRERLLQISGIGPKTFDYLCCLVGLDSVAVDRHVRVFASNAGVELKEYDALKVVVCFAADLLGIARRDFDSWIWELMSPRRDKLALFECAETYQHTHSIASL